MSAAAVFVVPAAPEPHCKHCGGELADGCSVLGARRCLACGLGTVPPPPPPGHWEPPCDGVAPCGGTCDLKPGHDGKHVCDSGGRPYCEHGDELEDECPA